MRQGPAGFGLPSGSVVRRPMAGAHAVCVGRRGQRAGRGRVAPSLLNEDDIWVGWQIQRVDGRLTRMPVKTATGWRYLPLLPIAREAVVEPVERQMAA